MLASKQWQGRTCGEKKKLLGKKTGRIPSWHDYIAEVAKPETKLRSG